MYQLTAVEQNHYGISSFLTYLLKKAESLHRDPREMQIYTFDVLLGFSPIKLNSVTRFWVLAIFSSFNG